MNDRDDDTWNDDGENDTRGTECDQPVDLDAMRRGYRVARADFGLGRTGWLWPSVAVAVDAAFLLGDPIGILPMGDSPDVQDRYETVGARVWSELCEALLATAGETPGVLVISKEDVTNALIGSVVEEFSDLVEEPDTELGEAFAAIVGPEFGVDFDIEMGSPGGIDPEPWRERPGTPQINWGRIHDMAEWIHRRIHTLPFEWTIGEE